MEPYEIRNRTQSSGKVTTTTTTTTTTSTPAIQNNSDTITNENILLFSPIQQQHQTTSTSLHADGSLQDDNKNRTIMYMHIGKTGGTTLDVVLRSNCGWGDRPQASQQCFDDWKKRNEDRQTASNHSTRTTTKRLIHSSS